jgi:hypothetical protein
LHPFRFPRGWRGTCAHRAWGDTIDLTLSSAPVTAVIALPKGGAGAFALASVRIFACFKNRDGGCRGSTSVAVETE